MALKPEQIKELDIASQRKLAGWAGSESSMATDTANLNYAAKQGYSYKPVSPNIGGASETPAGDLMGTLGGGTPQIKSDFASFQNLLRSVANKAVDKQPGISDVLSQFKAQIGGSGTLSPATAQTAIQGEAGRRERDFNTIFGNAMNTIKTMEEVKLEQSKNVNSLMADLASAGLLDQVTGEEYNQIMQTGVLPIEALQKINKRVVDMQNESAEKVKKGSGGSGTIKIGNEIITETGDTFTDTVNYIKSLKKQGMLNDINYREQINSLMEVGGYEEERRGEVESVVNQAMENNIPSKKEYEDDNNPSSDFEIGSTKTYKEQGLGTLGTDLPTYIESLEETLDPISPLSWAEKGFKKTKKYLTGK